MDEIIRRVIQRCQNCNESLSGHWYAELGSVLCGTETDKPAINLFLKALESRDWPAVHQFQQFESTRDILEAAVVKCPAGGGTLLAIRNPFELFAPFQLIGADPLTKAEMLALPRVEWRPFGVAVS